MPTYYTVIPGEESLSAEVDAPDKRHGKTVYLDFLVRNGVIPYGERSLYRKKVKMDNMDPGEVPTSAKLTYSYQGAEPAPREEVPVEELPTQVPQYQSAPKPVPESNYPVEEIPVSEVPAREQVAPQSTLSPLTAHSSASIYFGDKNLLGRRSPIMELSKSAGGK